MWEIGTEAAQCSEKDYKNGILVAVHSRLHLPVKDEEYGHTDEKKSNFAHI
jgi:hypothetical protein